MSEKIKSTGIEKVFTIQKIMQIIAVVMMVPFGFARLTYLDNAPDLIVSLYFELFAVMFIFVEFNIINSRIKFFFLNSSLGKGLFHMFLFVFCYGNGRDGAIWVDVFLSVFFFIVSILFLLMHCIFRKQEAEHIKQLIDEIK